MAVTSLDISDTTGAKVSKRPTNKKILTVIIVLFLLICAGVLAAYFMGAFSKRATKLHPPNVVRNLPPSASRLHVYEKAAVCADAAVCAEIGKGILQKNGTAVDAAIATLFCNGIVNMQSMGLGGGFLMTIYIRSEKKSYTLNAREFAPINAKPEMYKNDKVTSKKGPLAVGVPGELKGYWMAHQRFGKLPWKELIQPTVDLCKSGYNISLAQHDSLKTDEKNIKKDPHLKTWFTDPAGEYRPIGSTVRPEKLCETLEVIAEKGGDELYAGELARKFVDDIKEMGGIITREDMENYTAKWEPPVTTEFTNGDQLHSVGLPGGGLLLAFILNVMDGYNLTKDDIDGTNNTVLTYHRALEAYKFAYAKRTELGDPDFNALEDLSRNLTSREYADSVRRNISDISTSQNPEDYGARSFSKGDHGTAHMSVLAENGDAVSVTSTINLYFGAGLTSKQTGIVLNSVMDDFSYPYFDNYFGVPWSPSNSMVPRKRPLSSMSPSVVTDRNGDVRMVIGASGGTKISTAVAEVIMRALWFDQNVKEAVDAPRFHHQLFPMKVTYEYGTLQQVVDGLEALGHKTERYSERGSIVCAMFRKGGKIYANADFRKGGDVFGYN